MKNTEKIVIPSEAVYVFATITIALAVAILTSANFGVSMIVAPAYLLSLKLGFITFGQAEYIIQAGLFIILCIVLKRFRISYLASFLTCLFYGAVLDLWRLIPCFNPDITAPGSMAMPLRIVMFIFGAILTSFSVALFFKTYIHPQVYDFFVKAVTTKYNLKVSVFKTIFDMTMFAASVIMTFLFFGKITGIGIGTVIMALVNGSVIGFFSNLFDKFFDFKPMFKKLSEKFSV